MLKEMPQTAASLFFINTLICGRTAGIRISGKVCHFVVSNGLMPRAQRRSADHEQRYFATICLSTRYKSVLFAVRCPGLLLQILRFAQNDNRRVLRMTSLVTIDAATGGVKDLEHHICSPHLLRASSCPSRILIPHPVPYCSMHPVLPCTHLRRYAQGRCH